MASENPYLITYNCSNCSYVWYKLDSCSSNSGCVRCGQCDVKPTEIVIIEHIRSDLKAVEIKNRLFNLLEDILEILRMDIF